MTRALTTMAFLLAAAVPPLAAERLSLEGAMARARERAHEVVATRALARAGEERVAQAKSYRLPTISAQEVWLRTDSPADVFALQLQQGRFSFDDFVTSDPNSPDPLDNALTRFELTLPIYTGGELSSRIEQAHLAADAADETAVWAADEAALAAAEAYIGLAQVREQVTLLERSLETVEAHVRLASAYVDQGMLVRSELLRAEVERWRIADLLAEARGMARVAEANLSFRLADDVSTSWELEPLKVAASLTEPLADWLASATGRRDMAAARKMLEAGELEVRVQRAGQLPKLGVAARYDLNDDQLFGTNGQSATVMAMASIDIFSGGRHRAAKAVAEADVEAARTRIEQYEEGVLLQVREAYERATSARERHRTATAAQAASAEAERITEERFQQGVVKMIDLLDASTVRLEAETRELVSRAEARLADLRLALRSGRSPESALMPASGN